MGKGMQQGHVLARATFGATATRFIGDSVCKMGDVDDEVASVMTMHGDTAYQTEVERDLRSAVHGHDGSRRP